MAEYFYKAVGPDGANVEGTITALDEAKAIQSLSAQNYAVYELAAGRLANTLPWYNRELFQGGLLTSREVHELCTSLAALLERHIQLDEALLIVSETASTLRLRQVAGRVRERLLTGASAETAFDAQTYLLPVELLAMVRAGARSNTLADGLLASAVYFDQRAKAKQKLVAAMAYPVFLMVAALIVFLVILFTMVPALYTTIQAAGQAPGGTIALMNALSIQLSQHWMIVVATISLVVGIGVLFRKLFIARLRAIIPMWRRASETAFYARVARILHAQLKANQTLDQSLADTVDILGQSAMSEPINDGLASIRGGEFAGPIFLKSTNVPELFARLFDLGERTDNLTDLLLHAATSLEENYARILSRVTGLLTPILTLFVGGIIALLVQVLISAVLEVSQVAI